MFDETKFMAANLADYQDNVMAGQERARSLEACICFCARDCAGRISNTRQHIEATGKLFKDYTVRGFENDSKDATVAKLHLWEMNDPRFEYESEKLKTRKWGTVRSSQRGTDMARYRNKVRSMALETDADVFILVDADLAGWSIEGIAHSLSYGFCEYGGFVSNGLRRDRGEWVQYDAWAWRDLGSWRAVPFSHVKDIVPKRGEELRPMLSAFGGVGIYARRVWENSRYGGGDIEHAILHRRMRDDHGEKLALNPSQIAVVRW